MFVLITLLFYTIFAFCVTDILIMRCLAVVLLIPAIYLNVKAIKSGYYKSLRMKIGIAVCAVYALLLSLFMYNEYLSSTVREVKANAEVDGFIDDDITLAAIPKSLCEQLTYLQDTIGTISDIVQQREMAQTTAEIDALKDCVNSLYDEVMITKTEITRRNNLMLLFVYLVLSLGIVYKILCWWPDLCNTFRCVKMAIRKYTSK